MRLFIAEKPAMGREIAKRLPGPHKSKQGYIETAGGCVTWCIGHLLEQAPPDEYDPKFKEYPWKMDDLPILPQAWKLKITKDKTEQVSVIKALLKQASEVVNAGDPGREGQLIIDELLHFLGNKKPVLRILLNALDDATIKRELANLHDNNKFFPLYQAGLGRQRSDWLVGMNLSRAFTIIGGKQGYRGVLSVGRVQSPTLNIVVLRDEEIENFKPVEYWTIKGLFNPNLSSGNIPFWANWIPPYSADAQGQEDASTPDEDDDDEELNGAANPNRPIWLDDAGRIIDKKEVDRIEQILKTQPAVVLHDIRKQVEEKAPLPFDLSAMQILANAKWGASVNDTLQACQNLYEKGAASYPRTDCCYLPESQHADAPKVLAAIEQSLPELNSLVSNASPQIKNRAWDDNKMGEHHAIIPTAQSVNLAQFSDLEQKIYKEISKRFLAQFYPHAKVDKAKIVVQVQTEHLVARGRSIVSAGWRVIYSNEELDTSTDDKKEKTDDALLPTLTKGQPLACNDVKVDTKKTKPPSHYNQGTLLLAMKKVHLFVTDPVLRKKLKSVEGIGRSATRAAIIETLIRRGFVQEQGKLIISTPVGRALIHALPPKLIDPALTAMWETALDSVAVGKASLDNFMSKQGDWLGKLLEFAKATTQINNLPQSPAQTYQAKTTSSTYKPASKSTSGSGTSGSSKTTKSTTATKSAAKGKKCPKCNQGTMLPREVKNGQNAGKKFLGCSNYPECKNIEWK